MEPVLPQPQLVAVGRSPAALALTRLASGLRWRTLAIDDGGNVETHDADAVMTSLDLDGVDERSFVVIATQGHYDEDALERALATPAGYIGLVASAKRAEAVLGYLRDRGVADEQLMRVHAPAGIDLGHIASDEIAVAILAEIVRLRAAGELDAPAAARDTRERHEAIDPVCGMTVDVADARYRAFARRSHDLLLLGRVPRGVPSRTRPASNRSARDTAEVRAALVWVGSPHADRERVHRVRTAGRALGLPARRREDRPVHAGRRADRDRRRPALEGQAQHEVRPRRVGVRGHGRR